MKPARYVILNPSGNLTALVTEWGGAEDEAELTARLMQESEQVAYLDPPSLPGALARIRLMGGEFCGNAAMAAAGWLVRDRLRDGEEMTVPIEVSGAQGVLFCRILEKRDGFEGTVEMPRVKRVRPAEIGGIPVTEVQMEGITHLIREGSEPLEKEKAEAILKAFAEETAEEAAGLLDRNPETGRMRPLVYVRGSGTLVIITGRSVGIDIIRDDITFFRTNDGIIPAGTVKGDFPCSHINQQDGPAVIAEIAVIQVGCVIQSSRAGLIAGNEDRVAVRRYLFHLIIKVRFFFIRQKIFPIFNIDIVPGFLLGGLYGAGMKELDQKRR